MATGKVKWFSDVKGYGFIDTGEGKDLFVHFSAVQQDGYKSLREGQEVEYEVGLGPKGPQAEHVVLRPKADAGRGSARAQMLAPSPNPQH